MRLQDSGRSPVGNANDDKTSCNGILFFCAGDIMTLRLIRDADSVSQRDDDVTAASARLLQHWVRAVTRDRVLRQRIAWPLVPKLDRYDRLQYHVARRR